MSADPGSFQHFLDEVAAERVFVSGLGIGADSAWVTVMGDVTGAYAAMFTSHAYIYRALGLGLVDVNGPRVRLRHPHPQGKAPP